MYSSILGVVVPTGMSSRKMKSLLNLTTAQFGFEKEEGVLCESDRSIVMKVRHRVAGKTFVIKELQLLTTTEEDEAEEEKIALRVLREACFMASTLPWSGSTPSPNKT
ncbi:hypothetical protein PR202_gb13865 [Eleusine coracana subsp. coracana]|uniref:Uncharacterized protein n=1 Tax=Eleusine coracana subsp. coracana TaxID=191504 RepID=A0AAV5EUU1_ELECO|nr:hypothetical protein PR202_gb13865 [Eleusine coracana subsp. coracana]